MLSRSTTWLLHRSDTISRSSKREGDSFWRNSARSIRRDFSMRCDMCATVVQPQGRLRLSSEHSADFEAQRRSMKVPLWSKPRFSESVRRFRARRTKFSDQSKARRNDTCRVVPSAAFFIQGASAMRSGAHGRYGEKRRIEKLDQPDNFTGVNGVGLVPLKHGMRM